MQLPRLMLKCKNSKPEAKMVGDIEPDNFLLVAEIA